MKEGETFPLRFHWRLSPNRSSTLDSPDLAGIFETALLARVLNSRSQIAAAVKLAGSIPSPRIMIPIRYNALTPDEFLAYLINTRCLWNVVCEPFSSTDRREGAWDSNWYAIANDFLQRLRLLNRGADLPPFHVYGNSAEAAFLAIKHSDCLWRYAAVPEDTYACALPVLHFGKQMGLVTGLAARPSRAEAQETVCTGSPLSATEWLSPTLCRVPGWPMDAPVLVGSYEDVAESIVTWGRLGISQFLFTASGSERDIKHFRHGVLPLVREKLTARCTVPRRRPPDLVASRPESSDAGDNFGKDRC